jgi:hypothetical protein
VDMEASKIDFRLAETPVAGHKKGDRSVVGSEVRKQARQ